MYSGKITAGSTAYNPGKDVKERFGRIVLMHANHREDLDEIMAGDIAGIVGIKNTTTGDTLCDEKAPIILESMEFPEPVIRVAIEPKTKAGQDKMGLALAKLAEEDPTFKTYTDEETGQTIIAGMGELHLEIIVDRLLREFKVEANVGKPQVSYRETIRRAADQDTKYARQSGGKGQYGHVKITIEPNEQGKGYEFINKVVGGNIPKEYIPAVDEGIRGAMQSGVLAGYNVVDVKVTLNDGSYHEVDSSEMAFKIAGSMAFKEAMRKADPVLTEPIMKVVVTTPEEYMGDVIGDLNSRRGADPGDGERRRRAADHRDGPAVDDVRLRDRYALQDAGPRPVYDGARPLRRGAQVDRRNDCQRTRQEGLTVFLQKTLDTLGKLTIIGCIKAKASIFKEEMKNGKGQVREIETPCKYRYDRPR